MTYDSEVLADSPWGFWEQYETSGTTLADSSGSARTQTITGSPTLAQPDPAAAADAISWPGGATYSQTGTVYSPGAAYTAEAWVYLTAVPTALTPIVMAASGYNVNSRSRGIYIDTSGQPVLFDSTMTSVTGSALSLNAWHHIVVSIGAVGGKLRVDKVTVGTNATTSSPTSGFTGWRVLLHGGPRPSGIDFTNGSAVVVAKPAIYQTQLSDTRTDAHYDAMLAGGPQSASGTASLSLSASGATGATASGTASLSLSASGSTSAPAAGTASLNLTATGEGLGPGQATGDAALTLSASGAASGAVTGSASLTISASGTGESPAPGDGSASLTLTASGAARAPVSGSAHLTVSASANTGAPPPPYAAAVLGDAPIGYWRLGDPSGDTAHDSSGNGNDGTFTYNLSSDVVHGVAGIIAGDSDTATTLKTNTSYTARMNAPVSTTLAFTHEVWFIGEIALTWRGPSGSGASMQTQVRKRVSETASDITVNIDTGSSNQLYSAGTTNDILSTPHHLAITRDGTGVLSIYFDGQLARQWTSSAAPRLDLTTTFEIIPGGTAAATFDELALYDYALSPDRVAAHYLTGHGASGAAALTLSASGTVTGASARGAGTLALSALGQVPTPASGGATLELSASAIAVALFATDTTNALDGLDLLLTASVQQFTPIGATPSGLAERYDVSIPYPVPVLNGGRVE